MNSEKGALMRAIYAVLLLTLALAGCSSMNKQPTAVSVPGYTTLTPAATGEQLQAESTLKAALVERSRGNNRGMIGLLAQAATLGSPVANYELARIYATGLNSPKESLQIPRDLAKSNLHLMAADKLGYDEATRVLAWQYLRGSGVPTDIARGQALMEKAALTSVRAKREAGLLFMGFYAPDLQDKAKGVELLHAAYQSGNAEAAYYYSTLAGASNSESVAALTFSAQKGFPGALNIAGDQAVKKKDYMHASAFYMKAAMGGDPRAMYNYANNVLLGNFASTERELEAYAWFYLSAKFKNKQAPAELAALDGVKKMSDRRSPGRLDLLIQDTGKLIEPWAE
ncbi:hypothetical protein RYA05_00825 [Pseudomonas syringae pv. actinidiae]|nr:hypothetical protein [Pseudomonas syringae pv. actinidiae]